MMKLVDAVLKRAMRWRAKIHWKHDEQRRAAYGELISLMHDPAFLDRWDAHDPAAEKLIAKLEYEAGYR